MLMRLEWYMKSGNIKSTSNFKIFIDLLMDAKVLGEKKNRSMGENRGLKQILTTKLKIK
jgi:hypothetical protein